MRKHKTGHRKVIAYLSSIGILVFGVLYVYASFLYPGGSQEDLTSIGFDWVHNYWCNLMNEQALNGQVNAARPFALLALFLLCIGLALFFIRFARKMATSRFWKPMIKYFGVLAMLCSVLIATKFHNEMIGLASLFGAVALLGVIIEVYKSDLSYYKWSAVFSVFLLAANNYIYYSEHWIYYLPLLQKITFAFVLALVLALNKKMKS